MADETYNDEFMETTVGPIEIKWKIYRSPGCEDEDFTIYLEVCDEVHDRRYADVGGISPTDRDDPVKLQAKKDAMLLKIADGIIRERVLMADLRAWAVKQKEGKNG
ncbi:MAG: hypothetical protein WC356_04310 [Candidatus Micrarchaeia archaeon]|jgi:hypothetical protein